MPSRHRRGLNIHAQDANDPEARRLADMLALFDMVQHVHAPTHRCSNTLDLVAMPAQCQLDGDNGSRS